VLWKAVPRNGYRYPGWIGAVRRAGQAATWRAGWAAAWRGRCLLQVAAVVAGLAVLAGYLLPRLGNPGAHWPLWDVRVYWCGGQRAAHGAALYAPGACYASFTYPPFAAVLFSLGAGAPEGWLAATITAGSIAALVVLCWLSLGAARVRRRPEIVFTVAALAVWMVPVGYTLHLGEVNLILASMVAADLLRRSDGGWWQGIATGLAAGIKLTPLIFIAYLLITRRVRAAATATAAFAATVAAGFVLLPAQSGVFWLGGVFLNQKRIGNTANPANQALSGAVARLAGSLGAAWPWWLAAALLTGLAGLAVAAWAHRRGHRLAGVCCCALTGLLVSPFSWTHHWVWVVPLLAGLAGTAWRRRSPWYGLAAAAAAVVFSGLIPLRPPGHLPSLIRLAEGDLYILCGMAILAGTALIFTRERIAAGGWLAARGDAREPAAHWHRRIIPGIVLRYGSLYGGDDHPLSGLPPRRAGR